MEINENRYSMLGYPFSSVSDINRFINIDYGFSSIRHAGSTFICKFERVEGAAWEKNYRQMYEKLEK